MEEQESAGANSRKLMGGLAPERNGSAGKQSLSFCSEETMLFLKLLHTFLDGAGFEASALSPEPQAPRPGTALVWE